MITLRMRHAIPPEHWPSPLTPMYRELRLLWNLQLSAGAITLPYVLISGDGSLDVITHTQLQTLLPLYALHRDDDGPYAPPAACPEP